MRVVSGSLKGRTFDSVPGHRTHPMSEKIRGALFNALGDIGGLSLLDAYGGTGAIGIEAISRGASSVVYVDADAKAQTTAAKSITALGLDDKMTATRAYARAWSRRHQNEKFDLVILDPPYDQIEPKDILLLTRHAKPGGMIVLSLPPDNGFELGQSRQELITTKDYGDAGLYFYRQL